MTTPTKTRGSTVTNPSTTKYSLWTWIKGYAAWIALFPLYLLLWGFAAVVRDIGWNWSRKLLRIHDRTTAARARDIRIPSNPAIPVYMSRWWKIKRNAFFNIYFHQVFRSDDDKALHDHPWWSFSIVLSGGYYEHRILEGGVHEKKWYGPGSILFRRSGAHAHRLELKKVAWIGSTDPYLQNWRMMELDNLNLSYEGDEAMYELPAKTIFITGPVLRRWGFHAIERWVDAYDWDDYWASKGVNSTSMTGYAEQLKKD